MNAISVGILCRQQRENVLVGHMEEFAITFLYKISVSC